MQSKELEKILITLQNKKNQFLSEVEEFERQNSASYSPIDPNIRIDLNLFENELIKNFAFEEHTKLKSYYEGIVKKLKSDDFTNSQKPYLPDGSIFLYYDRKDFINNFYIKQPDHKYGEGELEYINSCFNGFLYSYQNLVNEIILLIESKSSDIKLNKKNLAKPNLKYGTSTTDIISSIKNHTNFLIKNSYKGQVLMEKDEYNRLQKELLSMIENGMAEKVVPFRVSNLNPQQIWEAFSNIHKDIYPKGKHDSDFEKFLITYFPKSFNSLSEKTIYGRFHNPYNQ